MYPEYSLTYTLSQTLPYPLPILLNPYQVLSQMLSFWVCFVRHVAEAGPPEY